MARPSDITREMAEMVAIQALSFMASEPERLGRFLAASGLGPDSLRAAANDPNFLVGVLDHLSQDEALLLVFAEEIQLRPEHVTRALAVLGGTRR